MTAPVRDWQVVLAKFFGALVFYLVLWVPTILYFVIFQYITGQTAAGSTGAYWGSYLMLLLLGMFYISIGCFASVLTRNQIIAAVISFCAITLHFFSGLITFILTEVSSDDAASSLAISPPLNKWARSRAARSIPARSFSTSA